MAESLSAGTSGYSKGDRIIAKVGRGEWMCGAVTSAGVKLKIIFDDGSTASVAESDFKDVKPIPAKSKKVKSVLDKAAAKVLIDQYKTAAKAVPVKTAKKAKTTKPASIVKTPAVKKTVVVAPTVKKTVIATPQVKTGPLPDADTAYPQEGYVFNIVSNSRIGQSADEYIVTGVKVGRKLTIVSLYKLNDHRSKTSLYSWKIRHGYNSMQFRYVRRATQAELIESSTGRKKLDDFYEDRTSDNKQAQKDLGIQAGDVVWVNYSDGGKSETVTDINHTTGKVAVYKPGRELRGMKRRFIHIKHISRIVTKGPGYFNAPAGFSY